MKNNFLKTLSFGLLSTTLMFSTLTFAEKSNSSKTDNIDVTQLEVTKEELSAIHVLSEVCPSLIKIDNAYKTGYSKLLKDYLPNQKNPEAFLKSLVNQKPFESALKEARNDAKKAGKKNNTEICEDVKKYQS